MSLPESILSGHDSDSRPLSPMAAERLGGLLAGLDKLDPILSLPNFPEKSETGLQFARFRLRSRLGAGRFGLVLLAEDSSLSREVVVKVPQPAVLADDNLRERFSRESRAAARLDHPGVVSVLEAGESDGLPYLAAAYIPGPSLRDWRHQHPGPVPAIDAARFTCAIARGVHHAHERGVLHCDLTPSNVLLQRVTASNQGLPAYAPLVTDFGLAQLLDDDPSLTRTFQVVGTPLYMAPEQARGDRRNLTARTDVYALGVMLYDLLVGAPPFSGATSTVLTQIQFDTPSPPHQRIPDVPCDLNAICMKCLEKNPADRYAAAGELAADLQRFVTGLPVSARSVSVLVRVGRWLMRKPKFAALALVVLTLVLAALGVAVDRWRKEIHTRAELDIKAAERTAAIAQAESADHRAKTAELYAILERVRQRRVTRSTEWARSNRSDLTRISQTTAADEQVALRTEVAAIASAIDLGPPRTLVKGFHGHSIAYDPSGRILAVGAYARDEDGVIVIRFIDPASGQDIRQLRFPADWSWEQRSDRYDGCRPVLFSYDGQRFIAGSRSGWLMEWDLTTSSSEPIARWRSVQSSDGSPKNPRLESVSRLAIDPQGRLWSENASQSIAVWGSSPAWTEIERHSGYLSRPAAGTVPSPIDFHEQVKAVHPTTEFHIRRVNDQELVVAQGDNHTVGRLALPDDHLADDNTIDEMIISSDGKLLSTTAVHAQHLKLWDLTSGRLLAARSLAPGTLCIAFRPDGRELAVVEDGGVQVFEVDRPTVMNVISFGSCPIDDADLNADGRFLVTTSTIPYRSCSIVSVFNCSLPSMGVPIYRVHVSPPLMNSRRRVGLSPDGEEVVTHHAQQLVRYKLPNDSRVELMGDPHGTRDIRFTARKQLWWIGGDSIFTQHAGKDIVVSAGGSVSSMIVGDDFSLVGRTDGVVVRVSPLGQVIQIDQVSTASISALARDGERIFAGTAAGDVILVADGRTQSIPQAHADVIWAIAVGPGGYFATGSGDRDVRIWSSNGEPLLTLPQTRPVRRLFWSAEGSTLTILAEGERGLRQWNLDGLDSEFMKFGLESGLP